MASQITVDHYAELELQQTATTQEITASYRRLALLHHPDKNPDKVEIATQKFQKIQEAHSVLSDPRERARYDAARIGLFGDSARGPSSHPFGFGPDQTPREPSGSFMRFFFGDVFGPAGQTFGSFTDMFDHPPHQPGMDPRDDMRRQAHERFWRKMRQQQDRDDRRRRASIAREAAYEAERLKKQKQEDNRRRKEEAAREAEKAKRRQEAEEAKKAKRRQEEEAQQKRAEAQEAEKIKRKQELDARKLSEIDEAVAKAREKSRVSAADKEKQEARWEKMNAETDKEKQKTCLHADFLPKTERVSSFVCEQCKSRRGKSPAFVCPLCAIFVCQKCLLDIADKRKGLKDED